jgi:HAE1 family hydrophobic/amphiphilic exporter-1
MSMPCRRRSLLPSLIGLALASPALGQTPQPPAQSAPQGAAQAGPERVLQLSLADALGIALRNNFDLEIQRLSTEIARYDALGSWGAFDPVWSVTTSASERESEETNTFSGATVVEDDDLRLSSRLELPLTSGGNLSFSLDHSNAKTNNRFAAFDISTTDVLTAALTQPLLRGAWNRYATVDQRARAIALERQAEVERETRARTLLDVYNAYWDLVSAQEELAVREIAVDLGRQQLAQDQRRLEVGAGTEVDVLQAETNVAQQEEQRLRADYALRQARDTLRRMLAPRPDEDYERYLEAWDWPIETLTALPQAEAGVPHEWRSSLQSALGQRPELAQRRLDIDAAEIELQRARSQRLPQLDLELSTSSAGFDLDPDEAIDKAIGWDFPSSSAALTFSMPLWNRTARNAERAARSELRRALLQYDRFELDLLAEVRTAVNEVDKQRESVVAAEKSRALAQRQLEAEETRQQVGLSTTFQVLQFQEDLAQALSAEVLAKASYAKAVANLAFVEGRLEDQAAGEAGAR